MASRFFIFGMLSLCLAGQSAEAFGIYGTAFHPASNIVRIQQPVPNRWQSPVNSLNQFPRLSGQDCERYGRDYGYSECAKLRLGKQGAEPSAPQAPLGEPNAVIVPSPPVEAAPAALAPAARETAAAGILPSPPVPSPVVPGATARLAAPTPLPVRRPVPSVRLQASDWAVRETTATESAPPAAVDANVQSQVGKVLLATFDGRSPSDEGARWASQQIRDGTLAGVVIRAENIDGAWALQALTASLKSARAAPPLVLIGAPGGDDGALGQKQGFVAIASPRELSVSGDALGAYQGYRSMAAQLATRGLTMNLGPSVHPCAPGNESDKSCFEGLPAHTAAFATAFALAHGEQGILTAMRYSGSALDTEILGLMIARKAPDALVVDAPADALAAAVAALRAVGFAGAIIYDASVRAKQAHLGLVTALQRGADLVLIDGDAVAAAAAIQEAIRTGELPSARIVEAAKTADGLRQRLKDATVRAVSDQSDPQSSVQR
jgi:hypothetical protein